MVRSTGSAVIVLSLVVALAVSCIPSASLADSDPDQILSGYLDRISGRSIWENGTELEMLGSAHHAYRCAGSSGANASAQWIKSQFEGIGLECWYEDYEFYGWDLLSMPSMVVSFDNGTGQAHLEMASFQAEQFSFPTIEGGSIGSVVVLSLPQASSLESFTALSFDPSWWEGIDVQGKVVLIGREVRWNSAWEAQLAQKLDEGPAALVFYYSQAWTSSWEVMSMASSGGRPLSSQGSYLSSHGVPSGNLDLEDSDWLLARMEESPVTAQVTIDSCSGIWAQSNVVARLPAEGDSGETVLLTAHYDSVMCPGFVDNAASVAALLEVAAALNWACSFGYRPNCTVMFVAFSGEEMGLVGSLYYYAEHASMMTNVRAVINVDCLGAGTVTHSSTANVDGLNLGEEVEKAADELGLTTRLEEGGSDQESFLYPGPIDDILQTRWGMSPDLPTTPTPVLSAVGVYSGPLTPRETAIYGEAGWIHTSRDSSTYSNTSGWISGEDLELQTTVVLMVYFEVSGTSLSAASTDGLSTTVVVALVAVLAAIVLLVLFVRGRSQQ